MDTGLLATMIDIGTRDSAFTPPQGRVIFAVAALALVFAFWNAVRFCRYYWKHRTPLPYAPIGLAFFLLSLAFDCVVVVYKGSFVSRYPLWLPIAPMAGGLIYALASGYDRNRQARTRGGDPSHRLREDFLTKVAGEGPPERQSDSLLVKHLKSIGRFFVGSKPVRIHSRYGVQESLSRLLELNGQGKVAVKREAEIGVLITAAHYVGRTNILPIFRGTLVEREKTVLLEGQIQIDRGVLLVLSGFTFLILAYLPFALIFRPSAEPDKTTSVIGIFAWAGLLEFFYLIGQNDAVVIVEDIQNALRG